MGEWHGPQGPFNIPDIPDYFPRCLKPWLFVFFVLIIQFSGGIYLAAVTDMVGSSALMQEDILMAGYASLIGMSLNFAVMFRLKFRFSNRTGLLVCGIVLIGANFICANSTSVPVLVATCFVAGWCRMWATFVCNTTIQLWITPVRDMAVFFCYVYLLVDGVIQISGIATIYISFFSQWPYMQWIMCALLALMLLLVLILIRPVKGPLQIPLLGIDWIGMFLWGGFMMCFTFICVYGSYYDWWDSEEITGATIIGIICVLINLWRATFLHHPYISFQALTNRNVIRATAIYIVFFTLLATEHVFEHSYASIILGYDETNIINLNWYVLSGVIAGCLFTYYTFALHRWRYKTMAMIGFALAAAYLGWFYFTIDYNIEKEMLFLPLFLRGFASVLISIVFLTSIVQSGLPFFVFPQALTVNGFTGAVMGAALGPALIGEFLRHILAKNISLYSAKFYAYNVDISQLSIEQISATIQKHSLIISMKEIYGWLLISALLVILVILISYRPVRPKAIFPKWKNIRRIFRRESASSMNLADGRLKNTLNV